MLGQDVSFTSLIVKAMNFKSLLELLQGRKDWNGVLF